MDDEILIELVHAHSIIYDPSHPKYTDSSYKERVWREIGDTMHQDALMCKTRWNNIRDNYRKSLKKTTTAFGQKVRRYKYSNRLTFLNNTIKFKVEGTPFVCNENVEGTVTPTDHVSLKQEQHENYEEYQVPCAGNNTYEEDLEPKTVVDKRRRLGGDETFSNSLLECILNKKETQPDLPLHPVDAFLAGISPTLKSLSPYYLNLAKSKIFATVQEYEMRMLVPAEGQNGGPNSSKPADENAETILGGSSH